MRKSYVGGLCALALAAGITGRVSSASGAILGNLLLDPGFEAGVNAAPSSSAGDVPMSTAGPWLGYNNWVAPYSGYYTSSVSHSGTQSGKTYSGPNAGVYQFAAVTPGDLYSASAFFDDRSADAMTVNQTDDVRLTFFSGPNGTGTNLGQVISPTLATATAVQNTWVPLAVNGVAPAGAQSVQWMAFFNNPSFGGGALYVDDASLVDASAIPEPASLGVLGMAGLSLLARRRRV